MSEHSNQTFDETVFASLDHVLFEECVFRNCKFVGIGAVSCQFLRCQFETCDWSLSRVTGSSFRDVYFCDCKAVGVAWNDSKGLHTTQFLRCKLSDGSFQRMDLRHIVFEECLLHNADFQEARLDRARFCKSQLSGARFHKTSLVETNFSSAHDYAFDPRNNHLKNTKVSLPEAMVLLEALGMVFV